MYARDDPPIIYVFTGTRENEKRAFPTRFLTFVSIPKILCPEACKIAKIFVFLSMQSHHMFFYT